eukprot:2423-Alexandrium_andersonii.AAC.1
MPTTRVPAARVSGCVLRVLHAVRVPRTFRSTPCVPAARRVLRVAHARVLLNTRAWHAGWGRLAGRR